MLAGEPPWPVAGTSKSALLKPAQSGLAALTGGPTICQPAVGHETGISQCILPFMTTRITLDQAGRVLIPKALREELELQPGDALQLESEGERILLRPVRGTMPLQKEGGIWVFRTGKPLRASTTGKVLDEIRNERDRMNMGKRK